MYILNCYMPTAYKKAVKSGPELCLVDTAIMYIMEWHYPDGCSNVGKRAIRKTVKMLAIKGGAMYF